ncbi:hypothetical protein E1293_12805 [Actinomadura darangshiensis]|uniref:Carboxylic ester hydrolase n=1 Tax=Actinomadura darangshiensis TaxID=705336 RepID=A0A4R5BE31_9ACTN|nr:carboxylesterase family protein [Actinomadura darangshiensis]TDD84511.1 hypothetical protein E1293_12805 [Actinomadura darangshiensis]
MPAADPVAETSGGPVRGVRSAGVSVFQGVPYAEAPVGELRFAPPRERRAWDGMLDATRPAPAAPQPPSRLVRVVGPMRFAQSEDCLTVNVWTPGTGGDLPVLVWLHGGAYTAGAGGQDWYAAERLAARGMVVVSVTYRLGALGFLYLGEPDGGHGAGNFGLLDQLAALRWVRANAAAFGGDPDSVTVAGQSAGALSILALAAGPHAGVLGPRLIMQSLPGGIAPAAPADAARVAGLYLAELGLGPGDAARLRELPVADLLAAQRRVMPRAARLMDLAPPSGPARSAPTCSATRGARRTSGRPRRNRAAGPPACWAASPTRRTSARPRRGWRTPPGPPTCTGSTGTRARSSGRATAWSCRSCSAPRTPGGRPRG